MNSFEAALVVNLFVAAWTGRPRSRHVRLTAFVMRLINLRTLELEEFYDSNIPPYAILSHRWGHQEVSYKDLLKQRNFNGPGYDKILGFCELAQQRTGWIPDKTDVSTEQVTIEWGWVDTCCIDKRSSAELSEAINSMFFWYHNAAVCYVYLADVPEQPDGSDGAFKISDWFKRGFTLQELLAPWDVVFCNSSWEIIGHKCTHGDGGRPQLGCENSFGPPLNEEIAAITSINARYLRGPLYIFDASVACRMSWAAGRRTSRCEDIAYCLMGIFAVNMPLLYGEGAKAFLRLQEEIIRSSSDQSVFAWKLRTQGDSLLAINPIAFAGCEDVQYDPAAPPSIYSLTNRGLEIRVKAWKAYLRPSGQLHYAFNLNCFRVQTDEQGEPEKDYHELIVIPIVENGADHVNFVRLRPRDNIQRGDSVFISDGPASAENMTLYVKTREIWHDAPGGRFDWSFNI